ncbi:MAG: winged helix-turn-helix transcriptional regulator, partial [Deltaproteobacteria bacterium]|nr:winged helix-turn-helix transcriptional regulator [Deltaproteobacteria bacterium]
MNRQEIHTLKLLEAVADNQVTSQRKLACRLNISLGLVNTFIRKLTGQGFFEIRQSSRQNATYTLTAKGQAEKTRLTYDYICYSYQFFK